MPNKQIFLNGRILLCLLPPALGLKVQCERSSHDMITTKDAGFTLTSEKIFSSWEHKMLMGGDFDVNSLQRYPDSLKDVLKQTMLNQEVIFRKQVHELHRLYTMQKSLMKDNSCGTLDKYNLGKASIQSTLGPFPNQMRCDLLAIDKTYTKIPMAGSTQSVVDNDLLQGGVIFSRLQQRPLDLQLSTGHFINHICEDLLREKNNRDSVEKSAEKKHHFHGENVSCCEEVNLSLSIGGNNRRKSIARETWNDKITQGSPEIIDLEESTETISNEDAKPVFSLGCTAPITSGDQHDPQAPAQSSRNFIHNLTKDQCYGMTDFFVDCSEVCQEGSSLNEGSNECHGDLPCDNMFPKGVKLFTSYEAAHLDLNKNQLDESSFHSNEPMGAYPSPGSSSGVFAGLIGKFNGGACSTPVSLRQPYSNDISRDMSAISNMFGAAIGSKACIIDLESMPGHPLDLSEDPFYHSRNPENHNIELPLSSETDRALPEVKVEKGKEDLVLLHPYRSRDTSKDGQNSRSPASCKFACIADDNSSSIKTMQSRTDFGESNLSPPIMFQNSEPPQVPVTPCQQDLRSSVDSELKHQRCDLKKGESTEVDYLVQKAALSLICISLEGSSTSNQYCITKSGSNQIENEEQGEKPQYSLDSYESLVLKLKESSMDDCVSSKPFEINEMDKKDCGVKLKRGRRLKDFQKDILPSLASLSRHEIWEDINIMEGVIRSREYKRLRAKTANAENWFTPVRSRRSKLNYVGRKYYS